MFSKLYGYKYVKVEKPELDIALIKFNKLELIAEVKWRNEFKNLNDEIYSKLNNFECKNKYLISKSKIKSKINQLTLDEILNLCKNRK